MPRSKSRGGADGSERPGRGGERGEKPARRLGPSTLAVHAGEPRPKPGHSLATPIIQTATYTFADTQELKELLEEKMFVDRQLQEMKVPSDA